MGLRRVCGFAVIIACCACVALSAQAPGSADPPGPPAPVATECAGCHAEVAREWQSSLHRQSFSDPLFQAGYRVDHRAFCRGCHAPRSEGADPRPGTAAHDEGITCTECHTPRAAHPSAQPARDFGERACGACHQFHFPRQASLAAINGAELRDGSPTPAPFAGVGMPSRSGATHVIDESAWMQRTLDEWRESAVTESCADCHMPRASGHASHAFTVDAPRIAGAIAIEGELLPPAPRLGRPNLGPRLNRTTEVVLRLSAVRAGHAVPTGDVLRALELSVWPASAPDRIQRRELTRVFGTALGFDPAEGITARTVEREDTRIPPRGERVERFVFDEEIGEVRYRLDYLHVNRRQAAIQGIGDDDNRLTVAEGVLSLRTRHGSGPRAPSPGSRTRGPRASQPAPR